MAKFLPFVFASHVPSGVYHTTTPKLLFSSWTTSALRCASKRRPSITIKIFLLSNPSQLDCCNNFYSVGLFPTSQKSEDAVCCMAWYSNLNIVSWLYWVSFCSLFFSSTKWWCGRGGMEMISGFSPLIGFRALDGNNHAEINHFVINHRIKTNSELWGLPGEMNGLRKERTICDCCDCWLSMLEKFVLEDVV